MGKKQKEQPNGFHLMEDGTVRMNIKGSKVRIVFAVKENAEVFNAIRAVLFRALPYGK